MSKVTMVAAKSLSYGGYRYDKGEHFRAKSKDARLLRLIGRADVCAPAPAQDTAAQATAGFPNLVGDAVRAVAEYASALKAEAPPGDQDADGNAVMTLPDVPKPKRTCRRRDQVAE